MKQLLALFFCLPLFAADVEFQFGDIVGRTGIHKVIVKPVGAPWSVNGRIITRQTFSSVTAPSGQLTVSNLVGGLYESDWYDTDYPPTVTTNYYLFPFITGHLYATNYFTTVVTGNQLAWAYSPSTLSFRTNLTQTTNGGIVYIDSIGVDTNYVAQIALQAAESVISSNTAGVSFFNGRTGAVTLAGSDVLTAVPGVVTQGMSGVGFPDLDIAGTAKVGTIWATNDAVLPERFSMGGNVVVANYNGALDLGDFDGGISALSFQGSVDGSNLVAGTVGNAALSSDVQAQLALAGTGGEAGVTGRSFYVTTNGNDSTAVVNDSTHPFATLYEWTNGVRYGVYVTATNGDTVVIGPGTYSVKTIPPNPGVRSIGVGMPTLSMSLIPTGPGDGPGLIRPNNNTAFINLRFTTTNTDHVAAGDLQWSAAWVNHIQTGFLPDDGISPFGSRPAGTHGAWISQAPPADSNRYEPLTGVTNVFPSGVLFSNCIFQGSEDVIYPTSPWDKKIIYAVGSTNDPNWLWKDDLEDTYHNLDLMTWTFVTNTMPDVTATFADCAFYSHWDHWYTSGTAAHFTSRNCLFVAISTVAGEVADGFIDGSGSTHIDEGSVVMLGTLLGSGSEGLGVGAKGNGGNLYLYGTRFIVTNVAVFEDSALPGLRGWWSDLTNSLCYKKTQDQIALLGAGWPGGSLPEFSGQFGVSGGKTNIIVSGLTGANASSLFGSGTIPDTYLPTYASPAYAQSMTGAVGIVSIVTNASTGAPLPMNVSHAVSADSATSASTINGFQSVTNAFTPVMIFSGNVSNRAISYFGSTGQSYIDASGGMYAGNYYLQSSGFGFSGRGIIIDQKTSGDYGTTIHACYTAGAPLIISSQNVELARFASSGLQVVGSITATNGVYVGTNSGVTINGNTGLIHGTSFDGTAAYASNLVSGSSSTNIHFAGTNWIDALVYTNQVTEPTTATFAGDTQTNRYLIINYQGALNVYWLDPSGGMTVIKKQLAP